MGRLVVRFLMSLFDGCDEALESERYASARSAAL
jgi:hypothetical protein